MVLTVYIIGTENYNVCTALCNYVLVSCPLKYVLFASVLNIPFVNVLHVSYASVFYVPFILYVPSVDVFYVPFAIVLYVPVPYANVPIGYFPYANHLYDS